MDDLVKRNDLYYKKFTDVPFTGKVTGQWDGQIKNGKRKGSWIKYYENGQLRVKENYKDGNPDGLWEYFNEDGSLTRTETYKDGELVE